jgi:hypothetical protein
MLFSCLSVATADTLPFWSFGPHASSASGYIGSLLVEQLLRTTDVKRIYVLFRGKRGSPAKERLLRILHSGLFHLVRDDNTLLSKVRVAQALPAALKSLWARLDAPHSIGQGLWVVASSTSVESSMAL